MFHAGVPTANNVNPYTGVSTNSYNTLPHLVTDLSRYSKNGLRRFARSIYPWSSSKADDDGEEIDKFDKQQLQPKFQTFQTEFSKLSFREDMNIKTALAKCNRQPESFATLKNFEKVSSHPSNQKRVIVIVNIPEGTGISSILAQVCGGPMERINFYRGRGNRNANIAELYFIFPEHARKFYEYATTTRFFIVNGYALQVEWADRSNSDDLDEFHPQVPSYLAKEILHWGARRCLVFSKVVPSKTIKNTNQLHYPSAKTHFTKGLDISQIRKDLVVFGEILDIGPVISRKICFSVQFADVRSAVVAKKVCETVGSPLFDQFKDWSLWYGKDPTDLPCKGI